ncbi:hypothetical protein GWI33_014594 [Rhynchophorus ferrugineus]|uniref:Uncharacterized protein n=1 Tax=Rhynchophorus ferrugineus TaxID=354439 RepID=A0A834MAJ4_RHYFE|nr:hypothetical protein GWI33_014594 [Rhynchophorus ferrugineus]
MDFRFPLGHISPEGTPLPAGELSFANRHRRPVLIFGINSAARLADVASRGVSARGKRTASTESTPQGRCTSSGPAEARSLHV